MGQPLHVRAGEDEMGDKRRRFPEKQIFGAGERKMCWDQHHQTIAVHGVACVGEAPGEGVYMDDRCQLLWIGQ